jgi:hypothetical protein
MKKLGLNPTETEIQDLINEVERNGFIYYPAFCRVVMRKLREDDEENFRQELFRTLVGAKPYTDGIPAKLYNINKEYLTFDQVDIDIIPGLVFTGFVFPGLFLPALSFWHYISGVYISGVYISGLYISGFVEFVVSRQLGMKKAICYVLEITPFNNRDI